MATIVRRLPYVDDAQSALLYFANWHFLGTSNDYFASEVDKSPYLHFWSLSIEEQFYLFFPVLIVAVVAVSRRWRWRWTLSTVLAVLLGCSVACQFYWMSVDPVHAYYGTDARLYQLLAGALLATMLRSLGSSRFPTLLSGSGLVLLLLVASGLTSMNATWHGILATAASVLLVLGVMSADRAPITRLLSRPVPVYLGKISYGTYLWHWPVILVLGAIFDVRPVILAALAAGIATGLAALSYQVFEMPIRQREWRFTVQWPIVASGLAVSLAVAVLVMPPLLRSVRQPSLVTARGQTTGITFLDGPVPTAINYEAVAHDIGPPQSCSQPEDCYMVRGPGPTVVLVGDSHARMLLPMFEKLAVEKGFTLAANTQTGCPWQADIVNDFRPPKQRQDCIDNRGPWYDTVLPQLHPDLVVLVSQSYDVNPKYTAETLSRVGGSDESLEQLLQHTSTETLDTITGQGTAALVVQNTLRTDSDPLDCLAAATLISDCAVAVPIEQDKSDSYYVTEDAKRSDMFAVNINPVICPHAPLCRPILNHRVVWRNFNHLTTRIAVHLREKIWAQINQTGALNDLGP